MVCSTPTAAWSATSRRARTTWASAASPLPLLRTVQSLLTSLDITFRIYRTSRGGGSSFSYTRKDGKTVSYTSAGPSFDLCITGRSLRQYAGTVGFELSPKRHKLRRVVEEHGFYSVKEEATLVRIERPDNPQDGLILPPVWTGLVDGFVCERSGHGE